MKTPRTIALSFVLTLMCLLPSGAAAADSPRIYWANLNGDTIGVANLDGTAVNQSLIRAFGGKPTGVAVDGRHIYWTNSARNTIGRANLDGTGVNENFITDASQPYAVAVDAGHVYWTNHDPIANDESVGRANLDGSHPSEFFLPATADRGVAVDGAYIYWAGTHSIWRARLNGTSVDASFITGLGTPMGIAVDATHVYWTDSGGFPVIGRANIDGTGVERQWIRDGSGTVGLAVSTANIYWSTHAGAIARAPIGGVPADDAFITGAQQPVGVALSAQASAPGALRTPPPPKLPASCAHAPGGGLTLANVASSGSGLVAVGSDGLIAEASQPGSWTVSLAPVSDALRGAVWTGSRWVVVGDAGTILSSVDGRTWQLASGIPVSGLRAVAARPGLVVAAGSGGTVVSSPDGLAWTAQNVGLSQILWGGTTIGSNVVLSGKNATVLVSADGMHWTSVPTFPRPTFNPFEARPLLWQLAANGSRLVAVGDFGAVLDGRVTGLHAANVNTFETLRGVAFGGGVAIAVGTGGTILRFSPTLRRWLQVASPTAADLRDVAFTGSQFVAVGDQSTVISSIPGDSKDWRVDVSAMPCALLSVAHGAGRYVAVGGSGRILSSPDGTTWSAVPHVTGADLYSVAHGSPGWVAVGSGGRMLFSTDGRSFRPFLKKLTHENLHAVTWTGTAYLAGGDGGRIFYSTDAATWHSLGFAGTHSIRDFATEGGTTVAVGAGTVTRITGHYRVGAPQAVGFARFQTSVAARAGRFVIVGHNGEALVSTDDGRSWSASSTGVQINLDRVVFARGRFIATGEGQAITSADGLHWQALSLPTAYSIRSVSVVGSQLIAVGDGGAILRSPDGGTNWTVIAG